MPSIKRCPECNHEFMVYRDTEEGSIGSECSSTVVSRWVSADANIVKLQWYDCPVCGCRTCIQADDQRTLKIVKRQLKVKESMSIPYTNRFRNREKQSNFLKKLDLKLAESRRRVASYMQGVQFIDRQNGNEYTVNFEDAALA